MDYNPLVVVQSNFEDACDQMIVAINILKRSVRTLEPAAPAEVPTPKPAKAKKAAATPEPVQEAPTPVAEALTPTPTPAPAPAPAAVPTTIDPGRYETVAAIVLAHATKHGKASAVKILNDLGFKSLRDVTPDRFEEVSTTFTQLASE